MSLLVHIDLSCFLECEYYLPSQAIVKCCRPVVVAEDIPKIMQQNYDPELLAGASIGQK